MATETLKHIITALWSGQQATAQAAGDIANVGEAGKKSQKSIGEAALGWAKGALTLGAVTVAAKETYQAINEGAQLELARTRFDNLAESIGSTSDAMLTKLRDATSGMISDAELIGSAGQIISLGLMDTEDGVVRLARVIGELGWNSQETILTFANNSKMRLDSLGLSVSDVEARTQKFIAAGYDMDKAFDLAVLEAGEAKIELLGSTAETSAGKLQKLETRLENVSDRAKLAVLEGALPMIDAMIDAMDAQDLLTEAVDRGLIAVEKSRQGHSMYITDLATGEKVTLDAVAALLEEQQALVAAAAGADVAVLATQRLNSETGTMTSAFDAAMAAVDEYTESVTASADATYEMRREGIDSSEALRAKLVADYEEQIAKTEELEQATLELAQSYAGEFKSALDASDEGTENFTLTMFDAAVQAGANEEALRLLALATGEYTEEQIEAALKTAALRIKAEELGIAIAEGRISVEEATEALIEFQETGGKGVRVPVDSEDVMLAEQRAIRARMAVEDLDGSHANVTVTTHFTQVGTPYSGPYDTYAPGYASGTHGWEMVPGPQGAPFPVVLHGGEMFNVTPAGQAPASQGAPGPTLTINGDINLYEIEDARGLLDELAELSL